MRKYFISAIFTTLILWCGVLELRLQAMPDFSDHGLDEVLAKNHITLESSKAHNLQDLDVATLSQLSSEELTARYGLSLGMSEEELDALEARTNEVVARYGQEFMFDLQQRIDENDEIRARCAETRALPLAPKPIADFVLKTGIPVATDNAWWLFDKIDHGFDSSQSNWEPEFRERLQGFLQDKELPVGFYNSDLSLVQGLLAELVCEWVTYKYWHKEFSDMLLGALLKETPKLLEVLDRYRLDALAQKSLSGAKKSGSVVKRVVAPADMAILKELLAPYTAKKRRTLTFSVASTSLAQRYFFSRFYQDGGGLFSSDNLTNIIWAGLRADTHAVAHGSAAHDNISLGIKVFSIVETLSLLGGLVPAPISYVMARQGGIMQWLTHHGFAPEYVTNWYVQFSKHLAFFLWFHKNQFDDALTDFITKLFLEHGLHVHQLLAARKECVSADERAKLDQELRHLLSSVYGRSQSFSFWMRSRAFAYSKFNAGVSFLLFMPVWWEGAQVAGSFVSRLVGKVSSDK